MQKKYSRVYVEITNTCNRSCSFCPGTKRPRRRMTTSEFSTVCERLKPVTDYIYLHVMGEPLSHPDIAELIEIASARGFKVAITTNGTLLPKVGDAILGSSIYKVNISLHSFEEGGDEVHCSYVESCLDFADRASERGILTTLRLWNRGCDDERNARVMELLREKFPGDWAMGARGARIRHRLHLEEGERFDWPDMAAPDLGDKVFCHGLGDHFGILSDGTVIPCCLDREGAIALGNVFESNICDILSSERAAAMCEGFSKKRASEELCRRCGYARRFKI